MPKSTRANSNAHFELCYLRHQYLRKVKKQPTREEMEPYHKIVENFAGTTFYTYKNLFLMVGLDLEDVVNVGQIQVVSFVGLFALERNPKKLADFKRNFRSRNSIICSKADILNKNQANFTYFLKQRLQELVRICSQKAKNIKGAIAEEFVVFRGLKQPPKDIEDLLEDHEKYEYSPLTTTAFRTIKKRMNNKQEGPVYLDGKTWYVCVPIRKKNINFTDFTCNNYNPYDNLHNMTPEEVLDRKECTDWDGKWLKFNIISNEQRKVVIQEFIHANQGKVVFKDELKTAKRFLEQLSATS